MLELVVDRVEYLKSMLSTHGDLIVQRWTKKTKDKRGVLLDSVARNCFGPWPPITRRQLELFADDYGYRGSCEDPSFMTSMLGSGLCSSWINMEEFAEDKMKLLSFLHVRSAYPPCDWASFDAHEMKRYFRTPLAPLMFNAKCVRISSEDYGSMVDFDVSQIHSGEAVGYPRAWATMCVQLHMVQDLRKVVDKLVDGAPPSGNVNWTNLVTSGLRNDADSSR
jgi:hypothetical protein